MQHLDSLMFSEFSIVGSNSSVTINNITIMDVIGNILPETVEINQNLTELANNSYFGAFVSPENEFRMIINGVDDNGYIFSYVSDVSVEPTRISLSFGK